jgi:hypothetical protein
MFITAPRVAPALMLTLLVCGCAAPSSGSRNQVSLEYSSCQSVGKPDLVSCDQLMEMDAGSKSVSGYIEAGRTGSSISRRNANSR